MLTVLEHVRGYARLWNYEFHNVEKVWDEINGCGATLQEQRLSLQMLLYRWGDIAVEIKDKLKRQDKTSEKEAISKCNEIVRNYMKSWPKQGCIEEWKQTWQRFCQKEKERGCWRCACPGSWVCCCPIIIHRESGLKSAEYVCLGCAMRDGVELTDEEWDAWDPRLQCRECDKEDEEDERGSVVSCDDCQKWFKDEEVQEVICSNASMLCRDCVEERGMEWEEYEDEE